jgi:hypothetical protein
MNSALWPVTLGCWWRCAKPYVQHVSSWRRIFTSNEVLVEFALGYLLLRSHMNSSWGWTSCRTTELVDLVHCVLWLVEKKWHGMLILYLMQMAAKNGANARLWQRFLQGKFQVPYRRFPNCARNVKLILIPFQIYFKLQMGFYRYRYHYDNTTHKYTSHISHTNTHITQNNATKKQTNKTNELSKLHKHWRTCYSQWVVEMIHCITSQRWHSS